MSLKRNKKPHMKAHKTKLHPKHTKKTKTHRVVRPKVR